MQFPTIHSNGTGRESLLRQTIDAMEKIRDAMQALADMAPNGRDYYPQGQDALKTAGAEHRERIAKLKEVLDELETIAEHIADEKVL